MAGKAPRQVTRVPCFTEVDTTVYWFKPSSASMLVTYRARRWSCPMSMSTPMPMPMPKPMPMPISSKTEGWRQALILCTLLDMIVQNTLRTWQFLRHNFLINEPILTKQVQNTEYVGVLWRWTMTMKVAPSGKNKTIAPQCLLLISQIDFFLNFEFDFTLSRMRNIWLWNRLAFDMASTSFDIGLEDQAHRPKNVCRQPSGVCRNLIWLAQRQMQMQLLPQTYHQTLCTVASWGFFSSPMGYTNENPRDWVEEGWDVDSLEHSIINIATWSINHQSLLYLAGPLGNHHFWRHPRGLWPARHFHDSFRVCTVKRGTAWSNRDWHFETTLK